MASTHHPTVTGTDAAVVGWIGAATGVALLLAPWVLGYSSETAALVNHLAVGAGGALVALLASFVHRGWAWLNVAAAAYTLIAIPAFAYASGTAIGVSVVLGLILGVTALGHTLSR